MLPAENLDNKIKKYWPKNGPSTQEVKKYVKKYLKEKIVIKCGGRVLLDPVLFDNFIEDIVTLKKLGLTPIVVHGGGSRIKKKLDELNIETKFIKNFHELLKLSGCKIFLLRLEGNKSNKNEKILSKDSK